MMARFWSTPGLPHKGWSYAGVEDLEEPTGECEMCGNEQVRYIHLLSHEEVDHDIRTGCVCAEKLVEGYVRPRRVEQGLRGRALRRDRWLTRAWRRSRKGNPYLRASGRVVTIFLKGSKWGFSVIIGEDKTFGPRTFATEEEAQLAAFEYLNPIDLKVLGAPV